MGRFAQGDGGHGNGIDGDGALGNDRVGFRAARNDGVADGVGRDLAVHNCGDAGVAGGPVDAGVGGVGRGNRRGQQEAVAGEYGLFRRIQRDAVHGDAIDIHGAGGQHFVLQRLAGDDGAAGGDGGHAAVGHGGNALVAAGPDAVGAGSGDGGKGGCDDGGSVNRQGERVRGERDALHRPVAQAVVDLLQQVVFHAVCLSRRFGIDAYFEAARAAAVKYIVTEIGNAAGDGDVAQTGAVPEGVSADSVRGGGQFVVGDDAVVLVLDGDGFAVGGIADDVGQTNAAVEQAFFNRGDRIIGQQDAGEGGAAAEGIGAQRFHAAGNADLLDAGAAGQGIGADGGHAVGNDEFGKAGAAAEGFRVDALNAGGKGDCGEGGAALEGSVTNAGDGCGNIGLGKADTAFKGFFRDFGDAGGQRDLRQARAVLEGRAADVVHALGNGDGGQCRAAIKGAVIDLHQPGGQFNGRQRGATAEEVVGNGGDLSGKAEGGEADAAGQRSGLQLLDAGRDVERGQAGAAGEGLHADDGQLCGQGDAIQTGAAAERAFADQIQLFGQFDARKGSAAVEGVFADLQQRSGAAYAGDLRAAFKGLLADGGDAVWNGHRAARAVVLYKGAFFDDKIRGIALGHGGRGVGGRFGLNCILGRKREFYLVDIRHQAGICHIAHIRRFKDGLVHVEGQPLRQRGA